MSQPSTRPTLYKGYRFPPEIISRCVWLYYRFGVGERDDRDLHRVDALLEILDAYARYEAEAAVSMSA